MHALCHLSSPLASSSTSSAARLCPRRTVSVSLPRIPRESLQRYRSFAEIEAAMMPTLPNPPLPAPNAPAPNAPAATVPAATVQVPTVPAPTVPAPTLPAPAPPALTLPAPALPAPTLQAPTLPAPALQDPTLPDPTVTAPALPAPTLPAPTLPASTVPTPTLFAPTLPAPADPTTASIAINEAAIFDEQEDSTPDSDSVSEADAIAAPEPVADVNATIPAALDAPTPLPVKEEHDEAFVGRQLTPVISWLPKKEELEVESVLTRDVSPDPEHVQRRSRQSSPASDPVTPRLPKEELEVESILTRDVSPDPEHVQRSSRQSSPAPDAPVTPRLPKEELEVESALTWDVSPDQHISRQSRQSSPTPDAPVTPLLKQEADEQPHMDAVEVSVGTVENGGTAVFVARGDNLMETVSTPKVKDDPDVEFIQTSTPSSRKRRREEEDRLSIELFGEPPSEDEDEMDESSEDEDSDEDSDDDEDDEAMQTGAITESRASSSTLAQVTSNEERPAKRICTHYYTREEVDALIQPMQEEIARLRALVENRN